MRADLGDLRRADHPVLVIGIARLNTGRDVGIVLQYSEEGCFRESETGEGRLRGGVEVREGRCSILVATADGVGCGCERRRGSEERVYGAGLQEVFGGCLDGGGALFRGRGRGCVEGAGDADTGEGVEHVAEGGEDKGYLEVETLSLDAGGGGPLFEGERGGGVGEGRAPGGCDLGAEGDFNFFGGRCVAGFAAEAVGESEEVREVTGYGGEESLQVGVLLRTAG